MLFKKLRSQLGVRLDRPHIAFEKLEQAKAMLKAPQVRDQSSFEVSISVDEGLNEVSDCRCRIA